MLYPIHSLRHNHTKPTTLLADLSGWRPGHQSTGHEALERNFISCSVQFFGQPEFGHEVVRCVVGDDTNGRQAPEDPILVLLWRIITYYLRKTLYYNYICNYKMWKFQLIFQQPYLWKCHCKETSTWEVQARCYSLLAPIVMQREW